MPPGGLAGSVDILPILSPGTREALLHPELVREADDDIEWNWEMPKFFARSWDEERKTKRLLYATGIVAAEDPEIVRRWHGQAVGNVYFGRGERGLRICSG